MLLSRTLAALLVVLTAAPALAQPNRQRPGRRPPALLVRLGPKLQPLKLARLKVEARVLGYITRTSMTMTFANPNPRVLEGDLYFPLPEGATVSGYALDIKGRMVDGVVVSKDKGRQVFEKIVRQGIDPGLVEWTKGNNFKTRVFPIPARGSRTIRVDYVADIVDRRGAASYRLPLAFSKPVGDVQIRLEVVKPVAQPRVKSGGPAGLKFGRLRDSYVAEARGKNLRLERDLIVALPSVEKQQVLVERAPDGMVYFAVNDFPVDSRPGAARAASAPRRITLFWDASASRAKADHERELRLLKHYLEPLGQVRVELAVVRHAITRRQTFTATRELLQALRKLRYDGGTQLGSLTLPRQQRADICLLFTDGISNFGREDPDKLSCPLYIFNGQATANHSFMRYLALKTGGEYFNMSRLSDKQITGSIGKPAFSFLGAQSVKGGGVIRQLFPSVTQPIHGRFTLVGRLEQGDSGQVRLRYGSLGRQLSAATFRISRADAVPGTLVQRYWAQARVQQLAIFPKRNAKEITAVGKRYGLVTPHTSLIVLESLQQYVEHKIAPPVTLPKIREQYFKTMARQENAFKRKEQSKLQAIIGLWNKRVQWWKQRFRYPRNFRYGGNRSKKSRSRRMRRPSARRPRSRPRPSPRPSRSSAGDALDDLVAGGVADRSPKAKKKGGSRRRGSAPASIQLKAWDPKTPYLAALKRVAKRKQLQTYYAQRSKYGTSPAFFLDCGDFFLRRKQPRLALQVLSNVVEQELENAALVRVLAHKLAQVERLKLATFLFEEARRLRPEEPQSHRDLALVLARRADKLRQKNRAAARELYRRALALLAHVVMNKWDRFAEIELIALMEFNAIWPRAKAAGVKQALLDRRLVKRLDVDVRIIMTWDADNTDMDMHVVEPSREEAYYGHNRTTIGGAVSRDFTRGYGPEEYILRRSMRGVYTVRTKFYGSSAAKLIGAVTLQVTIFTNYGRPNQRRKAITLRLTDKKETFTVGKIRF